MRAIRPCSLPDYRARKTGIKNRFPAITGSRLLLKGKLLFPAPEDCPLAGIRGKLAVTAQPGGGNPVIGRFPIRTAACDLLLAQTDVQRAVRNGILNNIPVPQQADQAAFRRFRGNMANTGSVCGSGKTAVRNKRHFRTKGPAP